MSSAPSDQAGLLKEVLEAVKSLTVNQTLLASQVDAISGRVNVLAGMKEVRDVADADSQGQGGQPGDSSASASVKKIEPLHDDPPALAADDVVPESPSLPATQLEGAGPSSALEHARKPSVTSRIILT